MTNRILQFVVWFTGFGLSHFVANQLGWAEQGVAFLYLFIGASLLFNIICFFLVLEFLDWSDVFRFWIGLAIDIGFVLLATWGASRIFDVNFYVAYQIMTFGQCLCVTQRSKKK